MSKLYEVSRDLRSDFISDVKNGNVSDLNDWLDSVVDNAVIYTSDCYDILQELSVCDFDDYIANFGEVTNVSSLAWFYLREYIYEQEDMSEYEEIINTYEAYSDLVETIQEKQDELLTLDEEDEDEREEMSGINEDILALKEELETYQADLEDFGFEFGE
jgi:hypothetical protein